MTDERFDSRIGLQRGIALFSAFQFLCATPVIVMYALSDSDASIREEIPQIAFSIFAFMFFAMNLAIVMVPLRLPVLKEHGFKPDPLALRVLWGVIVLWFVVALGNALLVQFA